jgi:enhancer of polycomb-like protein
LKVLALLNEGKDANGQPRKDRLGQCSEDTFEETMNFFEEMSAQIQPYASIDSPPIVSLEEMERAIDDPISPEVHQWLRPIYQHWVRRKGSRPLMPAIKVRVLDTSSEADDADPYICFRRREVRQTRKTRGRDAQVVEKLKKLRMELEQARELVQMVVSREKLNKEKIEVSRKVFEQRKQLKEVKISKNITGEKAADEELLVDQKVWTFVSEILAVGLMLTATACVKAQGQTRSCSAASHNPSPFYWRSLGTRWRLAATCRH